jgi:hypothetical protein
MPLIYVIHQDRSPSFASVCASIVTVDGITSISHFVRASKGASGSENSDEENACEWAVAALSELSRDGKLSFVFFFFFFFFFPIRFIAFSLLLVLPIFFQSDCPLFPQLFFSSHLLISELVDLIYLLHYSILGFFTIARPFLAPQFR